MSKPKILIDCDPGQDDALAILLAAKHLDLVGLTTVHGNNTLDNTTRNALAVLELAGLDLPVARGCADPIAQDRRASAGVHGKGGLDGAELPEPKRSTIDAHAVDFIIEMASQHRNELILAVIGPQTNVALALRREPRLKEWLREITIMGGSTGRGNVTPAAEFNIHCDPEAAWCVFGGGVPTRMVGLNVTGTTGFDDSDIARLRAAGRSVAGVIADLMTFYLARQRERRQTDVAALHDVCAIAPYVDETLFTYVEGHVAIELAGTHTRGMTVCDLGTEAGISGERWGAPSRIAIDVDRRRLVDLLTDTILSYP